MNGTALSIELRNDDGHDLLDARGELDLTNVHELEDALASTGSRAVVLDVSGLAFIDSAGLRAIDQANRRLAADGRVLLVVAPESSRAAWTFRVAGFAGGVVLDSLDAARLRAEG